MYLDANLLLSDEQAVTGSADSTNIINFGEARDVGTGDDLYLVVVVDETMDDDGDNSTVSVVLQGDSTSTITPDASQSLFTIPATTAAGSIYFHKLDPGSAPLQYQYVTINYTVAGGDLSAGAFTAFLAHDIEKYVSYPNGYTIS